MREMRSCNGGGRAGGYIFESREGANNRPLFLLTCEPGATMIGCNADPGYVKHPVGELYGYWQCKNGHNSICGHGKHCEHDNMR